MPKLVKNSTVKWTFFSIAVLDDNCSLSSCCSGTKTYSSLSSHVSHLRCFSMPLQECDEGYTRTSSGLYLGTCERCDCNGHASSCDQETGRCLVGFMLLFLSLSSLPMSNLLWSLCWNALMVSWRIPTCGNKLSPVSTVYSTVPWISLLLYLCMSWPKAMSP